MSDRNQNNLKIFFIKLIAITFSIIIIINVTYNLILADKIENINTLLQLNKKENIEAVKNKIKNTKTPTSLLKNSSQIFLIPTIVVMEKNKFTKWPTSK